MIRRDDGTDWLLIAQVDHARLAAEIAAVWGNDAVPPLPVPELLVPAIRHHDDGWREWAAAPQVDPETGKPRDFMEMPMSVSTALWTQSVEFCSRGGISTFSPTDEFRALPENGEFRAGSAPNPSALGGLWVSQHFCWLAEKARESRRENPEDMAAIDRFVAGQSALQVVWKNQEDRHRREFASPNAEEFDSLIEVGLGLLQFFDALSLWLCCAPPSEPYEAAIPGGLSVRWTPLETSRTGITEILAEPFPLSVDRLDLAATARVVAARPFADDADFQAALKTAAKTEIRWAFVRSCSR